jgi:hypothetical protein
MGHATTYRLTHDHCIGATTWYTLKYVLKEMSDANALDDNWGLWTKGDRNGQEEETQSA